METQAQTPQCTSSFLTTQWPLSGYGCSNQDQGQRSYQYFQNGNQNSENRISPGYQQCLSGLPQFPTSSHDNSRSRGSTFDVQQQIDGSNVPMHNICSEPNQLPPQDQRGLPPFTAREPRQIRGQQPPLTHPHLPQGQSRHRFQTHSGQNYINGNYRSQLHSRYSANNFGVDSWQNLRMPVPPVERRQNYRMSTPSSENRPYLRMPVPPFISQNFDSPLSSRENGQNLRMSTPAIGNIRASLHESFRQFEIERMLRNPSSTAVNAPASITDYNPVHSTSFQRELPPQVDDTTRMRQETNQNSWSNQERMTSLFYQTLRNINSNPPYNISPTISDIYKGPSAHNTDNSSGSSGRESSETPDDRTLLGKWYRLPTDDNLDTDNQQSPKNDSICKDKSNTGSEKPTETVKVGRKSLESIVDQIMDSHNAVIRSVISPVHNVFRDSSDVCREVDQISVERNPSEYGNHRQISNDLLQNCNDLVLRTRSDVTGSDVIMNDTINSTDVNNTGFDSAVNADHSHNNESGHQNETRNGTYVIQKVKGRKRKTGSQKCVTPITIRMQFNSGNKTGSEKRKTNNSCLASLSSNFEVPSNSHQSDNTIVDKMSNNDKSLKKMQIVKPIMHQSEELLNSMSESCVNKTSFPCETSVSVPKSVSEMPHGNDSSQNASKRLVDTTAVTEIPVVTKMAAICQETSEIVETPAVSISEMYTPRSAVSEENTAVVQQLGLCQTLGVCQTPVVRETPVLCDTPTIRNLLNIGGTPVVNQINSCNETPVVTQTPRTPVVTQTPRTPVLTQTPRISETLGESHTSVVIETHASQIPGTTSETSDESQSGTINETPVITRAFNERGTPATNASPAVSVTSNESDRDVLHGGTIDTVLSESGSHVNSETEKISDNVIKLMDIGKNIRIRTNLTSPDKSPGWIQNKKLTFEENQKIANVVSKIKEKSLKKKLSTILLDTPPKKKWTQMFNVKVPNMSPVLEQSSNTDADIDGESPKGDNRETTVKVSALGNTDIANVDDESQKRKSIEETAEKVSSVPESIDMTKVDLNRKSIEVFELIKGDNPNCDKSKEENKVCDKVCQDKSPVLPPLDNDASVEEDETINGYVYEDDIMSESLSYTADQETDINSNTVKFNLDREAEVLDNKSSSTNANVSSVEMVGKGQKGDTGENVQETLGRKRHVSDPENLRKSKKRRQKSGHRNGGLSDNTSNCESDSTDGDYKKRHRSHSGSKRTFSPHEVDGKRKENMVLLESVSNHGNQIKDTSETVNKNTDGIGSSSNEAEKQTSFGASGEECTEFLDILSRSDQYFSVEFHGSMLLCVSVNSGKFFVMKEMLHKCFSCLSTSKKKNFNHFSHKYRQVYIAKERDLKIPYRELPESKKRKLESYLVRQGILGKSNHHIGIISLSDALRLYHYFFGVKSCVKNKCIKMQGEEVNLPDCVVNLTRCDLKEFDQTCMKNRRKMSEKFRESHQLHQKDKSEMHYKGQKEFWTSSSDTDRSNFGMDSQSENEPDSVAIIEDELDSDSDETILYVDSDNEVGSNEYADPCLLNDSNHSDKPRSHDCPIDKPVGFPVEKEDIVLKGGIAELYKGIFRFIVVNHSKFFPLKDVAIHFDTSKIVDIIKKRELKTQECSELEASFFTRLEPSLPKIEVMDMLIEEEILHEAVRLESSLNQSEASSKSDLEGNLSPREMNEFELSSLKTSADNTCTLKGLELDSKTFELSMESVLADEACDDENSSGLNCLETPYLNLESLMDDDFYVNAFQKSSEDSLFMSNCDQVFSDVGQSGNLLREIVRNEEANKQFTVREEEDILSILNDIVSQDNDVKMPFDKSEQQNQPDEMNAEDFKEMFCVCQKTFNENQKLITRAFLAMWKRNILHKKHVVELKKELEDLNIRYEMLESTRKKYEEMVEHLTIMRVDCLQMHHHGN